LGQIEKTREKINYLKVWLGIFVVTLIGLVGWFASNFDKVGTTKSILTVTSMFIIAVIIHFLNKKILEKIDSLEEM
jgi:hypothetical protein